MPTIDLVVTTGQSQMSGTSGGAGATNSETIAGMAYDWKGGAFVQVDDSVSSAGTPYKSQPDSCLPAFCNAYTSVSGNPIAVVRCAIGGTALLHPNAGPTGDWSPLGTLYDDSVARVNAAVAALSGLPGSPTLGRLFIIWSQGFKDAVPGKDASGVAAPAGNLLADYADAQDEILANWQADLPASTPGPIKMYIEKMYRPLGPIIPSLTAQQLLNCDTVVAAQELSVSRNPDIKFGMTDGQSYYGRSLCRGDNLHYDMGGLEKMGLTFATAVLLDQGLSLPVTPPSPAVFSGTSTLGRRLQAAPSVPLLPREFKLAGTYTWKCPANVYFADLEGRAASGGGKGGTAGSFGGGGGGAGEYRIASGVTKVAVVPGVEYTVVIGAAGAGKAYSTAGTAGTGGDTTFDGATFTCKGGLGGGIGTGRIGGTGGTGGSGGVGTAGANGVDAGTGTGSDGGAGGDAPVGGAVGGAGGTTGSVFGKVATGPGAGGGGGKGNSAGADGANGTDGWLRITASA